MLVISWVPLIRASPSFASRLIGVKLWLSKTYLDNMGDMEQVLAILYTWRPPSQWQGSTSVPPPSAREQGGKGGRGRHWHQPGCIHRSRMQFIFHTPVCQCIVSEVSKRRTAENNELYLDFSGPSRLASCQPRYHIDLGNSEAYRSLFWNPR